MTTLLEVSAPFDGQKVSSRRWRAITRPELLDGPLRGVTNELAVSVPVDGLAVRVATGEASIGGVHVENLSPKRLVCDPADPVHGRVDLVVAGITYDTRAYLGILTGVPSANPVAPVPADNADGLEIPLAEVSIAAGDTVLAAADVTDLRMMAVPTNGAGGLMARLSVDLTVQKSGGTEQIHDGWTLNVVLRLDRVYRFTLDADFDDTGAFGYDIRVRDGGLTGTVLTRTNHGSNETFRQEGLFEALDEGLHTIVVTSDHESNAGVNLNGASVAAVANAATRRPWLLVADLGPIHT